ncbi:MAG: hypothetical protein SWX82_09875 [Cyanobacteriota bacterium]|nr:hypothetical protein [Cyanobacteriota bacterium]
MLNQSSSFQEEVILNSRILNSPPLPYSHTPHTPHTSHTPPLPHSPTTLLLRSRKSLT